MANIDWDKLGFDAYRTKTLVLARWKNGQWSEITETDLVVSELVHSHRSHAGFFVVFFTTGFMDLSYSLVFFTIPSPALRV